MPFLFQKLHWNSVRIYKDIFTKAGGLGVFFLGLQTGKLVQLTLLGSRLSTSMVNQSEWPQVCPLPKLVLSGRSVFTGAVKKNTAF